MKKEYISPVEDFIALMDEEELCANSIVVSVNNNAEDAVPTSASLSRDKSVWDDDME